jgi:hypothetical protein
VFLETLVSTYESTRRYNPEEQRHPYRRENLRSRILTVVLHKSKKESLVLREEHKLQISENKQLRKIFGPNKMKKVR